MKTLYALSHYGKLIGIYDSRAAVKLTAEPLLDDAAPGQVQIDEYEMDEAKYEETLAFIKAHFEKVETN